MQLGDLLFSKNNRCLIDKFDQDVWLLATSKHADVRLLQHRRHKHELCAVVPSNDDSWLRNASNFSLCWLTGF